ncbi:unnamed protein product [Miscanthus lutarioriparius]|uniref:Pollen Ole e 1 allergen and extensin family protein n=1 Tax=Miscanthus lutarioriparius TaxID=422564 RepID=A0A811PK01_9POAL|nr:unnamed protein product [Miscanthus lutarioriparius]
MISIKKSLSLHVQADRLWLLGALLLLLAVALIGAVPCESAAPALRLRGSVACLDCAAGHDLSGVVVAVKCAGDDGGGGGAGLHAAQTDGRGNFDVAVPGASASPCAARVLGATEQLCAPQGLTVSRVVPARAPGPTAAAASSYVLGSRLAFFTRCAAASGSSAIATTMAADRDRDHQGNAPREPELRPTPPAVQTPAWPPPFAGWRQQPLNVNAAVSKVLV